MTLKQEIAIEKIVENGGNVTLAMREAGYAEATVNNPSNLTKSIGYRGRLEELGLTEDLVTTALVEDIRDKKGKRTPELALAAELLGMRKMGIVIANQITVKEEKKEKETDWVIKNDDPRVMELAMRYERELMQILSN